MKYRICTLLLTIGLLGASARAETIRVTTYNIENFNNNFLASRMTKEKFKHAPDTEAGKEFATEIQDYVKKKNDEDNWEIAQTILDPKVNPDIIVIQECCTEKDLNYFNDRWLKKAYETVIVFPNNSGADRVQNVAMMLKPGFKVLEKRDQYYLEKDTVANERGDKLFARGPAFVKIQSPGGYVFWVGTNHFKSKSGNSGPVTAWRNREAVRVHQIQKEVAAAGPSDVLFLGDCNDESGVTEDFEKGNEFGGDTITNLVGPPEDKYVLLTKPLLAKQEISFGGYFSDRYRSFIDHAVATPEMATRVKDISIFHEKLAPAASDHYPVTILIEAREAAATTAPTTKPAIVLPDAMP